MGIGKVRLGEVIGLAILTSILVVSVLWHPSDTGSFVLCAFRRTTGIPCPGCGLTRSFCALAKGDLAGSFGFHWLGPVAFSMTCLYWFRGLAHVMGRFELVDRFDRLVWKFHLPLVGLGLLIAVWIATLTRMGLSGELAAHIHEGLLGWVFGGPPA